MSDMDDKYLHAIAKIMDRLIDGPGCKKGSRYYESAALAEYEFLRKKTISITVEFQEEKNKK